MKLLTTSTFSASLFALAMSLAPCVVRAQSGSDSHGELQQLEAEAKAAGERGELHKSYGLWLRAFQLHQSFDIAANLALVELQLKLWPEAAEHYAFALQRIPVSTPAEKEARLRSRLALAKQEVLTLKLHVEPRQAEVRVGNRPAMLAGTLPDEIYVEPGTVTIGATLTGHKPQEIQVQGGPGEQRILKVQLVPDDAPGLAPPTDRKLTPQPTIAAKPGPERHGSEPRPWWPAAAAAGAAGTGLVLGIAFTAMANSSESEYDALKPPGSNNTACGLGSPLSSCARLRELTADVERQRHIATGSFIAAGVFATSALVYWFWPTAPSTAARGTIGFDGNTALARINGNF